MSDDLTVERVQELQRLNDGPDGHELTFGDYRAIDLTIAELRSLLSSYRLQQSRRCETCQHLGQSCWYANFPEKGEPADGHECRLLGQVPYELNGQPFSCAAWTEKEK